MTVARKGLLAEDQVLEEDRVGYPDFVLGRGVGDLRHAVVRGLEDGARDVQGEILDIAEIEEQIPLEGDLIGNQGQL